MFKKLKKHVQEHKAELSQSSAHVQSLQKQSLTRLALFKRYRDVEYQEHLEKDFKHVLEAWGIHSEEERKRAIKSLYLRIVIIVCVALLAVILICYSSVSYLPSPPLHLLLLTAIALTLVSLANTFAILCTFWRITVLKYQVYTPIQVWFFGNR